MKKQMLYTHINLLTTLNRYVTETIILFFTNGWFLAESKLFLYWISTAKQMWKWTGTKQLFDKQV